MAVKQILYIDGWLVPKLIHYEVQYNKLWSEDSGRDMAGNNKGTLIGIYPKLIVNVGRYSKDEMSDFLKHINKAELKVKWYDPESSILREADSYYSNDPSIVIRNNGYYDGFSFNLIPNKKR